MMLAQATLLSGRPLRRDFGMVKFEALRVDVPSDDFGALLVPVLDAHRLAPLGHLREAWVADGQLKATLVFDDTLAGRRAYGMIEREEVTGVSCGVLATEVRVIGADGAEIDCAKETDRDRDPDLTFVVRRFELREVSVTSMPADPGAVVRVIGNEVARIRARMEAAQRRSRDPDPNILDDDRRPRRVVLPDRRLIYYGSPEPLS